MNKPERKPRQKTQRGLTMELMNVLRSGEYFYTDSSPKDAQAYASTNNIKISTKACILIEDYTTDQPVTTKLTKVTIP